MSIRQMAAVWQHSAQKEGALLVLLAIADFADDDGVAYPSVAALMRKARLSERAVQYALRQIQASGELVITSQAGPHRCNLYRLRVDPPNGADIAPSKRRRRVQFATPEGAVCDIQRVQPVAPEPSLRTVIKNRHIPPTPQGGRGRRNKNSFREFEPLPRGRKP